MSVLNFPVINPKRKRNKMRKFFTIALVGTAMALTACAGTDGEADYSYESEAPYADERTVGAEEEIVEPVRAERVFRQQQRK